VAQGSEEERTGEDGGWWLVSKKGGILLRAALAVPHREVEKDKIEAGGGSGGSSWKECDNDKNRPRGGHGLEGLD